MVAQYGTWPGILGGCGDGSEVSPTAVCCICMAGSIEDGEGSIEDGERAPRTRKKSVYEMARPEERWAVIGKFGFCESPQWGVHR